MGHCVLVLAQCMVPPGLLPKDIDPHAESFDELIDELNLELIIVGLVGLINPLKLDIPDTVRYEKKKSPMCTLAIHTDDFTH